jgi:hypothetical protein
MSANGPNRTPKLGRSRQLIPNAEIVTLAHHTATRGTVTETLYPAANRSFETVALI